MEEARNVGKTINQTIIPQEIHQNVKEKMDAADVEKIALRCVKNFAGIFHGSSLNNVTIMDLPVTIIVYIENHWIGIYMDRENIEVIDSNGYLDSFSSNSSLCEFVCTNSLGKRFLASPTLQSEESVSCGKYVLTFLYLRSRNDIDLCDYLRSFGKNFDENEKLIQELFILMERDDDEASDDS